MTSWTVSRQSREWIGPINVANKKTGLPVAVFEVATVAYGQQPLPGDWSATYVLEGEQGVLIGPSSTRVLAPGRYRLWVRVTATPEVPVLSNVGTILVT